MAAEEAEQADPQLRALGEYIRLQRQMADLSLRQLAEITHVSNAYLSQLERGLHEPSLRILRAIAQAFGLPADTLLEQSGLLGSTRDAERPSDTEEAIRSDPYLSDEDRDTLLRVYRTLRRRAPPA